MPPRWIRKILASAATRGRRRTMWETYRRAYAVGMDHAATHWDALCERGIFDDARSLFSIGPGDGELELRWLVDRKGVLGYAEGHRPHCRRLERSARRAGVAGRIIERHRRAFQHHQLQRRYDLLLAVHSWYSFGFDDAMLRKTLALLEPNGQAVLSLSSEKDFFLEEVLDEPRLTAESISGWAAEGGYPHEFFVVERRIPIGVVLQDDALTPQARDIVAFLKGRPWDELPERVHQRALDAFRRHAETGWLTRRHGCLHFRAAHG